MTHPFQLEAPPAHYVATEAADGTWFFTTPHGTTSGLFSRHQAEHLADVTRAQDNAHLAAQLETANLELAEA